MPDKTKELDIFNEVARNPKTGIGTIYSSEDVRNVWTELSKWILSQLKKNKSVKIGQLGTFTLCQWSLETGIRRELRVNSPVFLCSKSLMNDFDLHQATQYADDTIPLTPINHLQLSQTTKYQLGQVKSCIEEVVQCVRRVASTRSDFHLELSGLGALQVRRARVNFQFCNNEIISEKFNFSKPPCYRLSASLTPYKPHRRCCPIHSPK